MRIDTFKGRDKKLLFWEDEDDSAKAKEYMLEHRVTGIVFSKYLGFTGNTVTIHELFEFVDEVNLNP